MPLTLLLNPRFWLIAVLLLSALAEQAVVYRAGARSVQVAFDAYKNQQNLDMLAAEKAARAKEESLLAANQKVSNDYENLRTATATAVGALDADRMRLQSALAARAAAKNSSPGGSVDDSAKDRILEGCLQRYAGVAGDAQNLSDQVSGLQAYVTKTCLGANQ